MNHSIPDKIALNMNMYLRCSHGAENDCSRMAKWVYESPGMGHGPTVAFICDECKLLILRYLPHVEIYFKHL